jgi:hypothetical protein
MALLIVFLLVISLLIFHELGHVVAAKIMGLEIKKIGVSLKPYPHVFVAVEWAREKLKRYIFLFSGTTVTITLFFISIAFNFFELQYLLYAFIFQLIIETNPFFSDFAIAIVTNIAEKQKITIDENYFQKVYAKYVFSFGWYLHFGIWIILILLLMNLN